MNEVSKNAQTGLIESLKVATRQQGLESTEGKRLYATQVGADASAYQNPNAANDLSLMNISHLSQTYSQTAKPETLNNAPGMFVEGHEAFKTYRYVTNEDHDGLMLYLRSQRRPLDLLSMVDSRSFTVLAYAAYRNQTNCFKILFEYAWRECFKVESQRDSKTAIFQAWINARTEDQFTALHFATRHGNLTILQLLVERAGADLNTTNKFGSSAMHIAAQQDQPLSLYYLH